MGVKRQMRTESGAVLLTFGVCISGICGLRWGWLGGWKREKHSSEQMWDGHSPLEELKSSLRRVCCSCLGRALEPLLLKPPHQNRALPLSPAVAGSQELREQKHAARLCRLRVSRFCKSRAARTGPKG